MGLVYFMGFWLGLPLLIGVFLERFRKIPNAVDLVAKGISNGFICAGSLSVTAWLFGTFETGIENGWAWFKGGAYLGVVIGTLSGLAGVDMKEDSRQGTCRRSRLTHCFRCKLPLNSLSHSQCSSCGW